MELFIDFLLTLGMVVIFLMVVISFNKKKSANRLIILLLFSLLFFIPLSHYGEVHEISWLQFSYFIVDPIGFLIAPMLLAYTYAIYQSESSIWNKIRFHYTPFFIYFFLITIPNFILLHIDLDNEVLAYLLFLNENEIFFQFQAFYLMLYCFITLRFLAKYRKKLDLVFSNHENLDLDWFRYLNIGLLDVVAFNAVATALEEAFNIELDLSIFTTILLIFLMCFLAYYGMVQSKVLLPLHLFKAEETKSKTEVKHHLSNADIKEKKVLAENLHLVLEGKRLYLDSSITLLVLAKEMNTSDKKLSAFINHHLKTTFYDLINHYRVEEVKRRLINNDNTKFTLLSIALDAGFNSKTTFNRIFKKETGCSPSEFLKKSRTNS